MIGGDDFGGDDFGGDDDPNLQFLSTESRNENLITDNLIDQFEQNEHDLNSSFSKKTCIKSPASMPTHFECDLQSQSSASIIYTPFPTTFPSQSSSKKSTTSTPALEYSTSAFEQSSATAQSQSSSNKSRIPSRSTSPVPGSVETHGSKTIRIEDSGRVIAVAKRFIAADDDEEPDEAVDEAVDFQENEDNEDDSVPVPIMDENVRKNFKEECDVNVEFGEFTGRLYFRIHFFMFKKDFYRILR